MACLQVSVNILPFTCKATVSLFCNVGHIGEFFPLLVDEGILYVEENGETYILCVDDKLE